MERMKKRGSKKTTKAKAKKPSKAKRSRKAQKPRDLLHSHEGIMRHAMPKRDPMVDEWVDWLLWYKIGQKKGEPEPPIGRRRR
jgi:hypothetical protein